MNVVPPQYIPCLVPFLSGLMQDYATKDSFQMKEAVNTRRTSRAAASKGEVGTEAHIGNQSWKYAGKHRVGRRAPSGTTAMPGARARTVALIVGGTAAAAAIIAFLVTVLNFGQPSERGHTRSAPHTTTN